MAKRQIDIKLDNDDVAIAAGDFAAVESTGAHQRQLILNNKGDFKQNPAICVGAFNYLDDEGAGALVREINTQFVQDGMTVNKITIVNGVIDTNATYS